jgi:hypothetical protein
MALLRVQKKISTELSLGSDEEQFGAPIKYGNGIAFANIINDSLKLFTYDDEKLSLLNTIKVNKGSFIRGLKSINTNDIIILIHSDDSNISDLYKYSLESKQLNKEIALTFEPLKYPHLKDFGRDTLLLYYHNGGHSLLTGKPLTTTNISNLEFKNLSADSYYYTSNFRSIYNTNDNNLNQKVVIFNKDLSQKKILDLDLTPTGMIGYEDHAFNITQSSTGRSGKITMYNLTNQTSKIVLNINNQTFSTNGIKPLGLIGSKLYFLANLNQSFGKELYYIETGIPTSTNESISIGQNPFTIEVRGNLYKVNSESNHAVHLEFLDTSGKLLHTRVIDTNQEYNFDENLRGLMFMKVTDLKSSYSKSLSVYLP